MKIEYSNVKIPPNTVAGATITAISSRDGTSLVRVIEDGRDDLVISKRGRPDVHLSWSQVKGGLVAASTVAKAKQKKGSDE